MFFFRVLLIAGNIISVSTASGDPFTDAGKKCQFSAQIQVSPFREQYIAKLDAVTGTMPAADSSGAGVQQSDSLEAFGFTFDKSNSRHIQVDANIDPLSMDCLPCHDGSAATEISFNYRNSPGRAIQLRPIDCKDHPNGMDYSSYEALGKGQFKYISPLNSNIKLVNGRVGCLTCHNPLNPEKGHLVMSDFRSALCQTCHNL